MQHLTHSNNNINDINNNNTNNTSTNNNTQPTQQEKIDAQLVRSPPDAPTGTLYIQKFICIQLYLVDSISYTILNSNFFL